jgi:exopolyphosphatase/guanosine-5'-triphosphate,3'-diphosphate pyrophosphatase
VSGADASRPVLASDLLVVSGQLRRTARDVTGIAVRCPFGRPAVIETAPVLEGEPNPTLLYVTCPSAVLAISRAEAVGGVRRLKTACAGDEALRRALNEVTLGYRRRRESLAPPVGGPPPEAGIGGPEKPERASCLHAYAAALLAALAGWFDEDAGAAPCPAAALGASAAGVAGDHLDAVAGDAWERMLPQRDTLWCTDDRCARWTEGREGAAAEQGGPEQAATPPAENRLNEQGRHAVAGGAATGAASRRRVAAIDVGTISVRLLVADLESGRPVELLRLAEVTRLGEALRPGGHLDVAAVARTRDAVARYAEEARRLGATRVIVAGTSATRDAADGVDFVRSLGDENKASAMVLTGAEEAALAYAGASLDAQGEIVVLDVGGGSTELIRRGSGGGVEAVSIDLGASRATERWIMSDPPTSAELAVVYQEARAGLEQLRFRYGIGNASLVGVAGTVTTLACLDAGLQFYAAAAIHLRRLSLHSVDRLIGLLASMTVEERAALPCVQTGRAPVIVGGAVIVKAAMEALGHDELTVSERDLLDGLVLTGW